MIRTSDGRWTFNRRHAMHALGLDGTGALHPARIAGRLRIARGGVWIRVACAIAASARAGVAA